MEKIALTELNTLAKKVLTLLPVDKKTATILALEGNLGAGKTTFVQALGKELGVIEPMQSPTYVIMKKYDVSNNVPLPHIKFLVHLDLYRLEKPEEFAALKPEEFLNNYENLVCVEWPEKVGEALPKADLALNFSSENMPEGERMIEIQK